MQPQGSSTWESAGLLEQQSVSPLLNVPRELPLPQVGGVCVMMTLPHSPSAQQVPLA